MLEFAAPVFADLVAIQIVLPATGSPVKLIDLLAAGTLLTPSADLPNAQTNSQGPQYLNPTVDNGGSPAITGSSPRTRHYAARTVQVIIENQVGSFDTAWEATMSGKVIRVMGTPYMSPAGSVGVRRVYIQSDTATPLTVTAVCLLSRNAVAGL